MTDNNAKRPPHAITRRLSEFLDRETAKKAGVRGIKGGTDPLVTGMEYDSRVIKPGNLFFALPGLHTMGARFIDDALARGALVIVHGSDVELSAAARYPGAVFVQTEDPRTAMAPVADSFYDHPSRHMGIIGVTGTEGKSTTVYLVYQLLRLMGRSAGCISTVILANGHTEIQNPEHQTTPEAVTVQRLLAEMRANGAHYAVIEASSHGLSKRLNRLGEVVFDVGVMTNVNHEHLEFHGTWEQYRSDKAELFRALDYTVREHEKDTEIPSFGVVNADDQSAGFFAEATRHKTFTFSTRGAKADLSLELIESGSRGNWYDVHAGPWNKTITIRDRLPGAFNAGNVLAAVLVVSGLLNVEPGRVADLVPRLKPVRGRMTALTEGQPFEVLIDYAHTPSSFSAVFPPLRDRLRAGGGRIISVFGSAGERDTKKRSEQGEIAAEYSDIVILTDEDPRGEDPMSILKEIAAGIRGKSPGNSLFLIPDRPAAIRKAFSLARPGDLVILLGKGHENSIIYADRTLPYDEINEARAALKEMTTRAPGATI